jgi:uncharacterized protein YjbI with pentapeptide repeats
MSSIADPSVDEEAIGAINDAASYCRTLWAAFIGYAATLFILTSGTTHEALLRRTPVKLPLFDVDSGIPLLLFYVIAPLLLVLFHLNLLMKLQDLRVRVHELIVPLNYVDDDNAQFERNRLRRRLMAFDYATLNAGLVTDRRERVLLRVVTDTTVFIVPVLLLLFVQLQFLPYHDWKISWLHRAFVVIDLTLIAYIQLWLGTKRGPAQSTPDAAPTASDQRNSGRIFSVTPRSVAMGALFAVPVLVCTIVLAFPGEPLDVFWKAASPSPYSPLAGGDIAEKFGVRRSLYLSDRTLWAQDPPEDVVQALSEDATIIALHGEEDASPQVARTVQRIRNAALSLRGRNLSHANFENSSLIAVDFSPNLNTEQMRAFQGLADAAERASSFADPNNGTDISGASFSGADLRGALLPYARATAVNFRGANLQSSDLTHGQFQGSDFSTAQIQEANFTGARLQGALFRDAQLQGAVLTRTQLQGANLDHAQLREANFTGAAVTAEQLLGTQWQRATLDPTLLEQLKSAPAAKANGAAPAAPSSP